VNIYKILTLSLLMLLLVNGCSSVEHPFQIEVAHRNINRQISCSLTPGWNTFNRDDILLYPDSERPVPVSAKFPDGDEALKIRVYVEGELLTSGKKVMAFIEVRMEWKSVTIAAFHRSFCGLLSLHGSAVMRHIQV
jgi:hypothetical protein